VECFRRTAARETISVGFRLDDFREEFGNGTQSESMPSVPSIQRLSEHKLAAVRVVAEVQPVIHFTPILGTFRDRCPRFLRVYAADDDVHSVEPAFRV